MITVEDELQGFNRAGVKSNKGFEYAMAALEMANLMKKLREKE